MKRGNMNMRINIIKPFVAIIGSCILSTSLFAGNSVSFEKDSYPPALMELINAPYSISMLNEPLQNVLGMIAGSLGLNLKIVDNEILSKAMYQEYTNVSLKELIESIEKISDIDIYINGDFLVVDNVVSYSGRVANDKSSHYFNETFKPNEFRLKRGELEDTFSSRSSVVKISTYTMERSSDFNQVAALNKIEVTSGKEVSDYLAKASRYDLVKGINRFTFSAVDGNFQRMDHKNPELRYYFESTIDKDGSVYMKGKIGDRDGSFMLENNKYTLLEYTDDNEAFITVVIGRAQAKDVSTTLLAKYRK